MFEHSRVILVDSLKKEGRIKSKEVERAFLQIPRENFIPQNLRRFAYVDTPLEIGSGQTISAPHMVAIMCEALNIKKGQKILEIGAGSGYHAAIVSYIVGEHGCVYSIERIPSLAKLAQRNIELSGIKNITIKTGDGSNGLPEYAPYDRIYVTCAAPEVPPPLLEQLQDGGILLIPVGQFYSRLKSIKKEGDKFHSSDLGGCAFVPLLGKYGF